MSDDNDTPTQAPDEKTLLKKSADLMGIKYSNNIGVDALREKVRAAQEGRAENAAITGEGTGGAAPAADPTEETEFERNNRIFMEKTALVRIRITCMNPQKASLQGEFFTVGNAVIGTVKRFVPYTGTASQAWHVEQCILDHLRSREYTHIFWTKDSKGEQVRDKKYLPEFNIEVLPPKTQKELDNLAKAQAAGNRLDD